QLDVVLLFWYRTRERRVASVDQLGDAERLGIVGRDARLDGRYRQGDRARARQERCVNRLHRSRLVERASLAAWPQHLEVASVEGEAGVLHDLIEVLGQARGPRLQRRIVNRDCRRLTRVRATGQRHEFEQ